MRQSFGTVGCAAAVALAVAVAASGAGGCTQVQRTTTGGWISGRVVRTEPKILVMPVSDAEERKSGRAHGSGLAMTAALRDTLIAHGFNARVGEAIGLSECTKEARALKFDYVLKAVATEWVDKPTDWTGIRDSAALSLELYESGSGDLVATVTHRIEGRTAALPTDRFIGELADAALAKLLGWTPSVLVKK